MIKWLRGEIRRIWRRLREGRVVRLGPVELVWSPMLADLRERASGSDVIRIENNSKLRSIVFLHNAYYNFFYLARALRERGWDALSVSLEDPGGPNQLYYHGEDVNLYDREAEVMYSNIHDFFKTVPERFRMVHFYGIGQMSFFPTHFDYTEDFSIFPEDFISLKRAGLKIGYSTGGCNQGISQTAFRAWSNGCCDHCIWEKEPAVCSDRRNLAWGHKIQMMADLHATEGNPALDYQGTEKCYREPLTTALDPEIWAPDIVVPDALRLARQPDEIIVYHAVGNYYSRSNNDRNIKGTPAIVAAVERLRAEGHKLRLEFRTGMRNLDLRFVQAQCDIIIDQLNYGRYGATAREGMMLGKPTICLTNLSEPPGIVQSKALRECPLVSASENTVYDVLHRLVLDTESRREIGRASRRYALKWHSADACAARFEAVYDRLMAGKSVNCDSSLVDTLQ